MSQRGMTEAQQLLSRKYLFYKFFTNLFFVGAVWLYFYRIFINDQQVGFLDGMAFALGLIAEVPSGALADAFGRDKLVKLGYILVGFGFLIQACGSSFLPFFIGQAVLLIGFSFVSGADEALFFEKLNFQKNSVDWRKLLTRGSQVALLAALLANTIGGFLHNINPRIPWVLTGLAFFLSVVIIWPIREARPERLKQHFLREIKQYLNDIVTGFAQFRQPKLQVYIPLIITVQGLFYTVGWGLLRLVLLDRFHFSPFVGGLVIASCSVITFVVLTVMHKYAERMSERYILILISCSAIASLLLSIVNIGAWGYFVILILFTGENILYPFMSEIINNAAPEKQRATILSVASFMRMLPYVILAPLIGYLNTNAKLEYFLIGWSFLICIAIVFYFFTKKQDAQVVLK